MRNRGTGGGVDSFRFRCLAMGGQQTESERLADRHPNTPASTWLILGSDERDGSTDYGGVDNISGFRTDTILVLIKPKSGPSSLVSIPAIRS